MTFLRLVTLGALFGLLPGSCATADKPGGPTATRELASGAAQLRGGGIRMDVQVGRGLTTRPGTAGRTRIAPHATVTP